MLDGESRWWVAEPKYDSPKWLVLKLIPWTLPLS